MIRITLGERPTAAGGGLGSIKHRRGIQHAAGGWLPEVPDER
ncbi:hypothetical protein ACFOSC_31255 [Streptantibioticus rubrisoli]|nr:hypothetical protein [Streptantibioticus rubrisoli]